ncbi:MAG: FCD domain-containing protein [Rhodospirillaceae bacterium]|jgi:DNA-binding GntR family transcriptional regulator|nr:FCD domain-containing protein [Rhodospirillaceae bacterium]
MAENDLPSTSAEIQYLQNNSLPEIILKILETKILNHEILPGARINEKKLSEELGVSRIPIREACRKLEQDGLIEIRRNKGAFVRELEMYEVLNIYDVRVVLDDLAGRLTTAHATETEISQLQDLVDKMEAVNRAGDVNNFYPLNVAFHEMFYRFARNDRLARMYKGLGQELRLFRSQASQSGGDMADFDKKFNIEANLEHQAIVDALRERSAEKVSELLQQHLLKGRDRTVRGAEAAGLASA